MTSPTRLRRSIAGFLVLYIVVAVHGSLYSPNRVEWLPFFDWSLFTGVYEFSRIVQVEVTAVDGERFETPVNYFALGERFEAAGLRSTNVTKAGWRVLNVPEADRETAVEVFEALAFDGAEGVEYRVVKLLIDPLDFRRDGTAIERDVRFVGTSGGARTWLAAPAG